MSGILLLLLIPFVSSQPYYYSYHPRPVYSPSLFYSFQPTAVYSPRLSSVYSPSVSSVYSPSLSSAYSQSLSSVYSQSLRSLQLPFNQGYLPAFGLGQAKSEDIIQQTRTQADSLKKTLRYLARTPGPAKILNKVIEDNDNVCLNNVEEAIEAVEASAKIIEDAGPEIKQIIETVQAFEKLTEVPTVVREASKILRLLEVLIPKIAPASPTICAASNAEAFGSLRSLAALVEELSSNNDMYLTLRTRQELKKSAKIISAVTTFLTQLNKSFTNLDQFCSSDKAYNIEAITAIGEMMTGLADLFTDLGGSTDAEQIRKNGDFTKKVVDNINKLGDLDLGGTLECNNSNPGSFKVVADTLDDVADLIEEVGIEKLSKKQLGLDLDFTF